MNNDLSPDLIAALTRSPATMPVLFVGHGSPENALEDSHYGHQWAELGRLLPRPRAILSISAHWVTPGTRVTAMDQPRTIHDFWGFPKELYAKEYPAPGSRALALELKELVGAAQTNLDEEWGLDHGTWVPLLHMFPQADLPVVQLSLDQNAEPAQHHRIGLRLKELRQDGVLIMGSGNIVHNLGMMEYGAQPFPWAVEFDRLATQLVEAHDHLALVNYPELRYHNLAIPTNEHYLPLLYSLAATEEQDRPCFFCPEIALGSVSMRGVVFTAA